MKAPLTRPAQAPPGSGPASLHGNERNGVIAHRPAVGKGANAHVGVSDGKWQNPRRNRHVDGLAAAGFTDPEVPFRSVHGRVVHQLAQHVDGDTGVSVPLCIGYLLLILKRLVVDGSAAQRRE